MRRANGTGSVVRLRGNRRRPYIVKVSTRDKYGTVIQKPLSYHTTARDAQDALDDYNAKRRAGVAPTHEMMNYTVKNVYDAWSERAYKKLGVSSVSSHKAAWLKRISRYEGRKMRDVSLDEWQRILDEDEDNGLSQSLINNDAILIRALYSYSMERDIVGKDYSTYLDIPSVDSKKKKGALSDEQLATLEKMAADGFPWADTALIMCYTGYRITEFLTLSPTQYNPSCGGYFRAGIKSDAGKDRIVPIHPKISPYIKRWMGMGGNTVVILPDGGHVTPQWYRDNAFPSIREALGQPDATPHWCRHTFATRLYHAGVDEYTRKVLLGHSTKENVTAGYTHPTPEILAEAINKLT